MSSAAGQSLSLSARQEMYKARTSSSSPQSCLAQSPGKPTIQMEHLLAGPGMPASLCSTGFCLPSLVATLNAVYAILTEADHQHLKVHFRAT